MFNQYKREVTHIINNIIEICYFMRGSIQYETMFELTFFERQCIEEFIRKRLEQEKKNMHPVY